MKYVVNIYGREKACPSCVNAPGSIETYEWLQAILKRKYPDAQFNFSYIDLDHNDNLTDFDESIIEQINNDELFYPLVAINDEILQDGYVQIKPIQKWLNYKEERESV
jgi:disulfide oxidoreductase YuzD